MKKIAVLDTSITTLNLGDHIIMESAFRVLNRNGSAQSQFLRVPTHTPLFHSYQLLFSSNLQKFMNSADYKFVCGTNLLYTNMFRPWPNWNVNWFNASPMSGSILLGVGCGVNSKGVNFYTRCLYNKLLSKQYVHSVRDERTKEMMKSLGFKALNTGCPTTWKLTKSHCEAIPRQKGESVVTTLTDYARDPIADRQILETLSKLYKTVYYWPQGHLDMEYLSSLDVTGMVVPIAPSLESYKQLLCSNTSLDYVGTRLHGGIFAMQHQRRSIIIVVDHRAREMGTTYHLNLLERKDVKQLEAHINTDIITDVGINEETIHAWQKQFKYE